MPKGISRDPRTDKRRGKITPSGILTTPAKKPPTGPYKGLPLIPTSSSGLPSYEKPPPERTWTVEDFRYIPRTIPRTPDLAEVGPPMTLQRAVESVRDFSAYLHTIRLPQPGLTAPAPTDEINHPAHYTAGGIETIDIIESKQLNYHLGQVIKYITRAEYKGSTLADLKKAQWYLNREIENRSKAGATPA